jgi:GT2 family glycosyltransferase
MENIKEAKKNKIVVYTAIFGNKDNLKDPRVKIDDCDFVCFTDNPFLKSEVFDIRVVSPSFDDPARSARIYKLLPHKFLPEYEYSVWVDGSFEVLRSPLELVERYLKEADFATFSHPDRNCLYKEGLECVLRKKERSEIIRKQLSFYREEAMPEKAGLISSGIVLRKNSSEQIKEFNEKWWKQVETFSNRDQISFSYVSWKENLKYSCMPMNIYKNKYFQFNKHVIKESVSSFSEIIEIKENRIEELEDYIENNFYTKDLFDDYLRIRSSLRWEIVERLYTFYSKNVKKVVPRFVFGLFSSLFVILARIRRKRADKIKNSLIIKTSARRSFRQHSRKTAIITPTWNNEDYTIRCFDSIRKNTNDYIIIWVDNGSNPESREKVRSFLEENNIPHEKILNEENLGFVKATNQGMKRAMELGVDYLVLENNDTEVYAGWLDRMIEVAEYDSKIGMVGPITSPCNSWQSVERIGKKISGLRNLPDYNHDPEEYARIIKEKYKKMSALVSPMIAFFSALVKKEVVKDIGVLSEDYGIGLGDDDDYCSRAREAGWKIAIAKDVFVFHNHRTTFKAIYSEDEFKKIQKNNLVILRDNRSRDRAYDFDKLFRGKNIIHSSKIRNIFHKIISKLS